MRVVRREHLFAALDALQMEASAGDRLVEKDIEIWAARHFIVCEAGSPLAEMIADKGKLPDPDSIRELAELGYGLAAACA